MYGIKEITTSYCWTASSNWDSLVTSKEIALATSPAKAWALFKVLQATVTLTPSVLDKTSTVGLATNPDPNNKTFL